MIPSKATGVFPKFVLFLLFILIAGALFWRHSLHRVQADPAAKPKNGVFLPMIGRPVPTSTPIIPPPCTICSYDAYNCSDFRWQQDAQACYGYCYALTGSDVHRLDLDNNEIACEWLPSIPPPPD